MAKRERKPGAKAKLHDIELGQAFGIMLLSCGLDDELAGAVIGCSASSVQKRRNADLALTAGDVAAIAALYAEILTGKLDPKRPPQVLAAAEGAVRAVRLLRGIDASSTVPDTAKPRGRKPGSPNKPKEEPKTSVEILDEVLADIVERE